MDKARRKLCMDALIKFGTDVQMTIAMEECAELIQALAKYKRGVARNENVFSIITDDILAEMVDVQMMLDQLMVYFTSGGDRHKQTIKRLTKLKEGRLADMLRPSRIEK